MAPNPADGSWVSGANGKRTVTDPGRISTPKRLARFVPARTRSVQCGSRWTSVPAWLGRAGWTITPGGRVVVPACSAGSSASSRAISTTWSATANSNRCSRTRVSTGLATWSGGAVRQPAASSGGTRWMLAANPSAHSSSWTWSRSSSQRNSGVPQPYTRRGSTPGSVNSSGTWSKRSRVRRNAGRVAVASWYSVSTIPSMDIAVDTVGSAAAR